MSDARLLVALVDELVMGRGFDIRGFHDVVLGSGDTPLPVLSRVVGRWSESKRMTERKV